MHKNAKLTPLGRERRVKMMLDGQTPARAAALAGVSPGTDLPPASMQAYIPVGGRLAHRLYRLVPRPESTQRHRPPESRARLLQTCLQQAGASASPSNGS